MLHIKAYILSVISTAILCAVAINLVPAQKETKKLITTVAGLVLLVAAINPITQIPLMNLDSWFEDQFTEADEIVKHGQQYTHQALKESISGQVKAYIEDKAAALGADIKVELALSEDALPIPIGVCIQGDISPYVKSQLKYILETDLGIAGENQKWS